MIEAKRGAGERLESENNMAQTCPPGGAYQEFNSQRFLQLAGIIPFYWDYSEERAYCAPAFLEQFGYSLPNDCFFTETSSVRIHPEDRMAFRKALNALWRGKKEELSLECRLECTEGKELWCAVRARLVRGQSGEPLKLEGVFINIDTQKRKMLRLEYQAKYDGHSKLLNKPTTENTLKEFLAREGKKGRHALFMIDLDNFKDFNNLYGHDVADQVLKKLADRLRSLFRETDIVGRVGGDEFMVLLKNISGREIVCRRAQEVVDAFQMPFCIPNREYPSYKGSGSVGVAFYPEDGECFEDLYSSADAALRLSKEAGKGVYYICEEGRLLRKQHQLPSKPI